MQILKLFTESDDKLSAAKKIMKDLIPDSSQNNSTNTTRPNTSTNLATPSATNLPNPVQSSNATKPKHPKNTLPEPINTNSDTSEDEIPLSMPIIFNNDRDNSLIHKNDKFLEANKKKKGKNKPNNSSQQGGRPRNK